jgi:hypothetical protein
MNVNYMIFQFSSPHNSEKETYLVNIKFLVWRLENLIFFKQLTINKRGQK